MFIQAVTYRHSVSLPWFSAKLVQKRVSITRIWNRVPRSCYKHHYFLKDTRLSHRYSSCCSTWS